MQDVQHQACANCGRQLSGPYCAWCGQKQTPLDPTLSEFLRETTSELTNWDGKIPSTLKTLFLRPGRLTSDFIAGRRARWLTPLRVYLICSVVYFVSEPAVEAITGRKLDPNATITVTNSNGSNTIDPDLRAEIENGLPARIFGRDRILRAAQSPDAFGHHTETLVPKAMFVLLPVFACLTNIAWRAAIPHYPMHLYVALHLHSAWFGAMALTKVVAGLANSDVVAGLTALLAFAYSIWYGLLTAKRIFQNSWLRTILKSAAVGAAYSLCLFITSIVLLAIALATM